MFLTPRGVEQKNPGHALVVGGTGMLRGVCTHLAASGFAVTVLARGRARLGELKRSAARLRGMILPIAQDYRDVAAFRDSVLKATTEYGPIELGVGWIRSDAVNTHLAMADLLGTFSSAAYFEIRGSDWSKPNGAAPSWESRFREYDELRYRVVTLGFVLGSESARWLTDDEISEGIIRAINRDAEETIGTVRPWSSRPAY